MCNCGQRACACVVHIATPHCAVLSELAPDPPRSLRGRVLPSGHLHVQWEPPAKHVERVENYDVHYAVAETANDANAGKLASKVVTVVSITIFVLLAAIFCQL